VLEASTNANNNNNHNDNNNNDNNKRKINDNGNSHSNNKNHNSKNNNDNKLSILRIARRELGSTVWCRPALGHERPNAPRDSAAVAWSAQHP